MIWIEIKVYGILYSLLGVSAAISFCESSALKKGFKTVEFCSGTTATTNDTIVLDGFSTSDTPGQCTCTIQVALLSSEDSGYDVIVSDLATTFHMNPGCGTSLKFQSEIWIANLECGGGFPTHQLKEEKFTMILIKTQPPYNADYCLKIKLGYPGSLTLSCFSPYSTELPPILTTNMITTKREATTPATSAREATTVIDNDVTTLPLNGISEKVNILPSCQPCISSEGRTEIVVLATLTALTATSLQSL